MRIIAAVVLGFYVLYSAQIIADALTKSAPRPSALNEVFATARAQDAAPPAKPAVERLKQLSEQLHNRFRGFSGGGVDILNALEVIADALIEIEKRQEPVSSICFSYTLTINEAVSPEAAAAIARELQEAVPKIEEACALVHGGVR